MGRYTGPTEKLSRREGIELYLKGERMLLGKSGIERRGTAPPGQHGSRRQSRPSIYALQLREKQRAKRYYGVRERQFRRYVREAMRRREERMGDELLARLERRLDNVVYRLGLASTRAQARQLVSHRHVLVNGRRVTVPSFLVDEGDVVALRTGAPIEALARSATETVAAIPPWLEADFDALSGRVLRRPARGDATAPVDVQLIVEFYSRL
jgi:small subunit ribosomal protein S4